MEIDSNASQVNLKYFLIWLKSTRVFKKYDERKKPDEIWISSFIKWLTKYLKFNIQKVNFSL